MKRGLFVSLSVFALCSLLFITVAGSAAAAAKELTPEELISKHIQSIGDPTLLSSVQSRAFVGTTSVDFITGMFGKLEKGTSMFVSQGNELAVRMQFNDVNYPGEYITYDADKVMVGYMDPGQKSPLGDFLFRFNGLIKEGFFGGTLSLAWPLLDMKDNKAKLKCSMSKVEDRELYELEWPINVLGNVKIRMYFEPETYRHVRTEYTIYIEEDVSARGNSNYIGGMGEIQNEENPTNRSPNSDIMGGDIPRSVYHLIETFDNFKKVKGMTLPHKYKIEYSMEGQGHSFIGNWFIQADKWVFNQTYDAKIFQAHK